MRTLAIFIAGLIGGIALSVWNAEASKPIVFQREPEKPKIIKIEASIHWTQERIIQEIKDTFPEHPDTFVRIAKCESEYSAKEVNPTNGSFDKGIFQISAKYHGEEMRHMGLDPFNIADNIKYARILYERRGFKDWEASRYCWET